jgi:CPA2 family monovalent cation:H+ antiporter-2
LAPWDTTLAEFTVSSYSTLVGTTLLQSGIKEKFAITVAIIERAGRRILAPTRDELLLPGDKLFLIGTDESLAKIKDIIESGTHEEVGPLSESFGLTSMRLTSSDPFINRTIRECGIREAVNGLIVGLERDGQRYLSPDSSMKLLPKDLVWIVGDKSLIKKIR